MAFGTHFPSCWRSFLPPSEGDMKLIPVSAALLVLASCAAPIDTHGVDPQLAGRCKLMAHQEDRGHISFGLIPMAIAASNANARRQDVYDSCVAAAGSRESPPETLPAMPGDAAKP